MKALALDFDGVIADSAREAFAVALLTYSALRPGSPLAAAAADDAAREALFARFVALMPLGNRAEDYAVALAAIEAGVELADQADYDAFYASREVPFLRQFHERFYEERRAFAQRDPEGWLALLPPFQPFLDVLRRQAGNAVYAIATAKDRGSVERLLARYGVADLFDPRWIFDKETGVAKHHHIQQLAEGLGVDFAEIRFVDDKLKHLVDVAPLGVRCALAAWGYNGEREHELAQAAGIPVCRIENAEELLFGVRLR